MIKRFGRLGSKPQKWKLKFQPQKLRGKLARGSKVSLGLEKAKQATWTSDVTVSGEEELDLSECMPLEITSTLYETGVKPDGTALLQRKVGHFVLRSLKEKASTDDPGLRGILRYDLLASLELPVHEICPSVLDKESQKTLILHPKRGTNGNRVDVMLLVSSEILGDVSETDSSFSDFSAISDFGRSLASSINQKSQGLNPQANQANQANQALLDQVRVLQMNLERATVDNDNMRATYEERLAAMQQRLTRQPSSAPASSGSPRSVSSINTDASDKTAVSTRVEVLKIENRSLADRVASLNQELRVTQSALIAKESGQWRREHELVLERLKQQRLQSPGQSPGQSPAWKPEPAGKSERQTAGAAVDEEEEGSFSLPQDLRPLESVRESHSKSEGRESLGEIGMSDLSDANKVSLSDSGELRYFIKHEEEKDEEPSSLERREDLAAMVVLLEKAEEDNVSLREQLDMLTAVGGGPKRLGIRAAHSSSSSSAQEELEDTKRSPGMEGGKDVMVQAEMVYNTDENCFIDLSALEDLNAATRRNLDLQAKLQRTCSYFDEEREKVRVLKEVLCKWSPRLTDRDKDLLHSAGIILDLETQPQDPRSRTSSVRELFQRLGVGAAALKTE